MLACSYGRLQRGIKGGKAPSTSYQTNAGKMCKMWLVDSVTTSQSNKDCLLSSWLHLDIDYPFGAP